jgi:hypothetical protein
MFSSQTESEAALFLFEEYLRWGGKDMTQGRSGGIKPAPGHLESTGEDD